MDRACTNEDVKATMPAEVHCGTPAYMSPEAWTNRFRSTAAPTSMPSLRGYWMLTGRLPFMETTAAAMMVKQVLEAPEPPSRLSQIRFPRCREPRPPLPREGSGCTTDGVGTVGSVRETKLAIAGAASARSMVEREPARGDESGLIDAVIARSHL